MSYLKTSQKKHVETKTRTFSTPPKYLLGLGPRLRQTNHSSKGVRSTSYVHRTFVDAEAEVTPNDDRFGLIYNKKKVWTMKKSLQQLATAVGIKNVPTTATEIKKQISDQLSPENLDATLDKVKDLTAAKNIYRLVFGKNPQNMDIPTIKEEIRKNITGITAAAPAPLAVPKPKNKPNDVSGRRPATKINNFMNPPEEKTPDQKKGKKFVIDYLIDSRKNKSGEQEYYVKWKGFGNDENTWASESNLEEDGHEQDINDYWTKKKFLKFYDVAIKTRQQKIDDLSKKAKKDVKKMLIDLKRMLNKSGSVMISLLSEGKQQGISADKDKDNFLTTTELRKAIKNDVKLKQLFKIGKTGQRDEKLDSFVGWKTWFQSMDQNNDKKYSIQEFAKSYLAAALKNTVRDQFIDGDYAGETFDRMVALFGIADKKPSKPVVTSNVMDEFVKTKEEIDNKKLQVIDKKKSKNSDVHPNENSSTKDKVMYKGDEYTLRKLNTANTGWSLTTEDNKEFSRGKMFDFEELTLVQETVQPPVVARSNTPPVVTPSPGKFQVGDRVKSTSIRGPTAGLIGIITKRTEKAASVTWDNQTKSPSKPLTQLEMVKPTIMDRFQETKDDIVNEVVPVVTPSKPAKKKSVQPLPDNLKVGVIVKNTSVTGITAGKTGLITKRTPETAAVFWEDGNDTTNKPLKELKLVTISKEAEEKIKTIFNSYDTKRTDNILNNGEDLKFLQENLPRRSQVFLKKDLFEKPDGESGFSFDEFRFMLTVSPEMIAKFEEREAKSKSKVPAAAGVKPQRLRQQDPNLAKQESNDREKQAKKLAEKTKNAALARKQEKDRQEAVTRAALEKKEELDRQEKEEVSAATKIQSAQRGKNVRAADKKIIVELKDGIYSVKPNPAYKLYKEKLKKIPSTACNPTK